MPDEIHFHVKGLLRGGLLLAFIISSMAANAEPVQLPGDTGFTLTLKLGELPAAGDIRLAGESAADGGERWRLAVEGDGAKRRLVFEMRIAGDPEIVKEVEKRFKAGMKSIPPSMLADAKAGLFRVIAPLSLIGSGPHEVTVRLFPPVWDLDLFVDGVAMDKEWPLGPMVTAGKAAALHELVTSTNLEPSPLTDDQILARSGGMDAVSEREKKFFGPNISNPPYFRPRGIETHTGDCAPIFDGERWHLYYLKDRNHWQKRWGWGGLAYGHLSSDDLVHWVEHPDAMSIRQPYEGAIWTGSFAKIGDEYLGFLSNWLIPQWIKKYDTAWGVRIARSKDGIHFEVPEGDKPVPVLHGGDADIMVLEDGRYGIVSRGDKDGQRQMFFFTSSDLVNWKEEKCPFEFAPPNCDCPHYFRFEGGHYLFSSGVARKGESLHGPWKDIPRSSLGVPKTAPWKNGRRLIAGMIGDGGWGGDGVIHELIKLPNGNLGEKFVSEMTPLSGEVLHLTPASLIGNADVSEQSFTVKSGGEFAAAVISGVPQMARIRLTAKPGAGTKTYGVTLRGAGSYASGLALTLDPAKGTASFNRVSGPGKHTEVGVEQIKDIEGLGQSASLDIILGPEGLIDVEINGTHCITMRGPKTPSNDRLFLFSEGGDTTFENVEVREWMPSTTVRR